ncbi:hypothetical protein JXO52_07065 [bacterium]|nr:hypothetical protein [bacterium]
MKNARLILLFVFCTGLGATLSAQVKKYDIQSGIVTFEEKTDLGGFAIVKKIVVSFDDYGMKERKDVYNEDGVLEQSALSDGTSLYLIVHNENTAYRRGSAYRGTEYKFSWEEISAKKKESGEFVKGETMTIAGKTCDSYSQKSSRSTTVFAGWKGVCLLTDMQTEGMRVTAKAVAFEENAAVPAALFTIPAGMTVKDE